MTNDQTVQNILLPFTPSGWQLVQSPIGPMYTSKGLRVTILAMPEEGGTLVSIGFSHVRGKVTPDEQALVLLTFAGNASEWEMERVGIKVPGLMELRGWVPTGTPHEPLTALAKEHRSRVERLVRVLGFAGMYAEDAGLIALQLGTTPDVIEQDLELLRSTSNRPAGRLVRKQQRYSA